MPQLPFSFGIKFDDPTYHTSVSDESIDITEQANHQLHLYPITIFKTHDYTTSDISTSSVDTFGLRTDVHYTIVFITDEVKLSEKSLAQLVTDTLTKLGLKSAQTLGLEQTPQDVIELQSLQTISLDQSPKDTLKIDEYSYHISKELISQEQKQVLTLRHSDTLLIVFTKPITYYNITEVYFVLETQDHEVTIKRHGLLFDDSIIFIDRVNLQSGMYYGWFELVLDTGDVITVPESGREFVVIVG